jgi:hypothetical protein
MSILQCSNVRDRHPLITHVARLTLKAFALERCLPPIIALLSDDHHAPQRGGRLLLRDPMTRQRPPEVKSVAGSFYPQPIVRTRFDC